MILTTTPTLEGYKITGCFGLVRAWNIIDPDEERYRTVEVPRLSRKKKKEPKLKKVAVDSREAFYNMFREAEQVPFDTIISSAEGLGANCILGIQVSINLLSTTEGEITGVGGGGSGFLGGNTDVHGGGGKIWTSNTLVIYVYGTAAYCVPEATDESLAP